MDPSRRFPLPDGWLNDEDAACARSVARWADEQVIDQRSGRQADPAGLAAEAWPALVDGLGLGRALWPEAQGGLGGDAARTALTLAAAAEQVGRADLSLGLDLAVGQALSACCVLGPEASDEVRALAAGWLMPADAAGLAAWVGLTLARVGEGQPRPACLEGMACQVAARRQGEGWELSGQAVRPWSAGAEATVVGIAASVDPAAGGAGLFLVPFDGEGLRRGPTRLRVGLEGRNNATLTLDRVRVPAAACLGLGPETLRCAQTWLHLLVAAAVVGALQFADGLLADWGADRVIKGRGQRFRDNPLCASLMGELLAVTGLARVQVFSAAGLVAAPGECDPEGVWLSTRTVAAQVLCWASQVLGRAMELMGSAGYSREWNLERCWRDVRCLRSLLGGATGAQLALARRYYESQA